MNPPATSRKTGVARLTPDGAQAGERVVAVEAPIAISFFGVGYAVMMATPADCEDFAMGFARSERLIEHADEMVGAQLRETEAGLLLEIELASHCRDKLYERVRHRIGESSCGLCGIENLEQALRPLPKVTRPPAIGRAMLFEALDTLRRYQPLNAATGAVHAAALFDAQGALVAVREDVGRHNAFDKLVGHCLRNRVEMSACFALLTSRCSYELVEKAALAGIGLLVTVSAPTSLAVDRAREAGMTLIALARPDAMLAMTDPHAMFSPRRTSDRDRAPD